ncbi:hypothetical protein B0H11DRAFT_1219961 [Mycena galericulata]|nr:hypothetical protein B0H11DRAFT_1219961 [Mycena galericulata]
MPAIAMCAGSNDRCYHCDQLETENRLRTRGRCRVARYCSTKCQTADWRKHKQICMNHKANLETYRDANPTIEDELKVFMKWIDAWRNSLEVWGTFAADLANQSADFLLTHSYYLSLESRPHVTKARAKYQAVQAGMRADSEIIKSFQSIPDAEYRQQIIDNFNNSPPRRDVLRITVALPTQYFFSNGGNILTEIFADGREKLFTNPLSTESQLLSTRLVQAWSIKFAQDVEAGNTTGHMKILDDLAQAVGNVPRIALETSV